MIYKYNVRELISKIIFVLTIKADCEIKKGKITFDVCMFLKLATLINEDCALINLLCSYWQATTHFQE